MRIEATEKKTVCNDAKTSDRGQLQQETVSYGINRNEFACIRSNSSNLNDIKIKVFKTAVTVLCKKNSERHALTRDAKSET